MSFQAPVTISGTTYAATDIVKFHPTTPGNYGAGTFSMYFNNTSLSTSAEVPDALFVDAAGDIYFSTIGAGSVPGVLTFFNRDILKFHPTTLGVGSTGTYSLYFKGSAATLDDATNENLDSVVVSVNASGTPQLYFSTTGNFSVSPGSVSGARIDVLRFTGTVGSAPSGTYDMYRTGLVPSGGVLQLADVGTRIRNAVEDRSRLAREGVMGAETGRKIVEYAISFAVAQPLPLWMMAPDLRSMLLTSTSR